jgi:hypothetical protein
VVGSGTPTQPGIGPAPDGNIGNAPTLPAIQPPGQNGGGGGNTIIRHPPPPVVGSGTPTQPGIGPAVPVNGQSPSQAGSAPTGGRNAPASSVIGSAGLGGGGGAGIAAPLTQAAANQQLGLWRALLNAGAQLADGSNAAAARVQVKGEYWTYVEAYRSLTGDVNGLPPDYGFMGPNGVPVLFVSGGRPVPMPANPPPLETSD